MQEVALPNSSPALANLGYINSIMRCFLDQSLAVHKPPHYSTTKSERPQGATRLQFPVRLASHSSKWHNLLAPLLLCFGTLHCGSLMTYLAICTRSLWHLYCKEDVQLHPFGTKLPHMLPYFISIFPWWKRWQCLSFYQGFHLVQAVRDFKE